MVLSDSGAVVMVSVAALVGSVVVPLPGRVLLGEESIAEDGLPDRRSSATWTPTGPSASVWRFRDIGHGWRALRSNLLPTASRVN